MDDHSEHAEEQLEQAQNYGGVKIQALVRRFLARCSVIE
jgi:hypothetical protein